MASSFLEKLKKGMGVEELEKMEKTAEKTEEAPVEKKKEEKIIKKEVVKKTVKTKAKKALGSVKKKEKVEIEKIEKEIPAPAPILAKEEKESWPQLEGQLAVDVYQTDLELVIQSAIAGVKPNNIDVSIDDDVVTIKGKRNKISAEEGDYFYQECHWGAFSRQIISPVEINPGRVDASLKDGILTIRIPKIVKDKKTKIVIKG
ncbi:MAG: Hsp20/alpha crystallin family protein [Candidatus Nealsonbacteria bacterium]